MELYKRMPASAYAGLYRHGELCSNCGHEEMPRGTTVHRRRTRNYEKHCPSCHCPPERRRFSSPGRPRTSENVEAMINRCERVFAEPMSSQAIKKSQSSPLSQKLCCHECQPDVRSCYPRRPLQTRHQRRTERDRYPFRMKGDAANAELTNEDIAVCSKYARAAPVKSSLKKHNRCRQPERSPDEQECSESEVSMKCIPRVLQSRTLRVPDPGPRRRYVGNGDGDDVAVARNESDVELEKLIMALPSLDHLERPKQGDGEATVTMSEDDKRLERRRADVARTAKSRKLGDVASRCVESRSSALIDQSVNRSTRESAHLTKLDLHAAKTRILESIDRMLGTMDNAKNDAPVQQEQTEPETLEKITRELQENGWQLLFNGLTIRRDSVDPSRRIVRLECLNHIRQQLDKLYALESTLDNCPPKLQPLSSRDMPRNEERQQTQHQLEQKTTDS
ncbi:PREDICTED: uncharacterized protein LOC105560418 [Vollenhovia emeryi]|uniref:uncharacterized protein LOC105560418 n=1 Tax=Vollenhovia emeryi TaxID=411798 RepID=UPI0005F585D4|nr:PREDICTED: uncharacterized protein LOC105560418 [Vollenhovia emeryi]